MTTEWLELASCHAELDTSTRRLPSAGAVINISPADAANRATAIDVQHRLPKQPCPPAAVGVGGMVELDIHMYLVHIMSSIV